MHWTQWQDFGAYEWFLAVFGVAGLAWMIFCAWLVLETAAKIIVALLDNG